MLLLDLLAACANEGLSFERLRRYLPKTASQELDEIQAKFGPGLFRDIIWEDRAREAVKPPFRSSIAWPMKRASQKVVPFRSRQVAVNLLPPGFWC